MRKLTVALSVLTLSACADGGAQPAASAEARSALQGTDQGAHPREAGAREAGQGTPCNATAPCADPATTCTPVGVCAPACSAAPCPAGLVCTAAKWCAPDCRLPQNACPAQVPRCDQATGLCEAEAGGSGDAGGSQPVSCDATTPCPGKLLCAPLGLCVPDCRIVTATCPAQRPSCDTTSGLCK